MKTFKLHLIRHGLTQGNLDGVFVGGSQDLPLCAQGTAGLHTMAQQYRYPAAPLLFLSPMLRAAQTADILFPAIARRVKLEDLREYQFGEFEGQKAADLAHNEGFLQWLNPQSDIAPAGGEDGKTFAARTARALHTMLMQQVTEGITEAICVTHGGVIMSMLGQKALPKKPPVEWRSENGCGFTVQTDTAMLMRDGLVEAVRILPHGYMEE